MPQLNIFSVSAGWLCQDQHSDYYVVFRIIYVFIFVLCDHCVICCDFLTVTVSFIIRSLSLSVCLCLSVFLSVGPNSWQICKDKFCKYENDRNSLTPKSVLIP